MVYNDRGYLYEQIEAHDSAITATLYLRILSMDARGNVTNQTSGNGVATFRAYDPDDGQLNLIQSSKSTAGDIQHLEYDFDLIGNLVSRIDYRQNQSEAFFYDDLNRLQTVDLYADTDLTNNLLRTDTTSYDAAGNILSRTGGVAMDYLYGDDCAGSTAGPHAVCSAGGVDYSYDDIGNMKQDNSGRVITYNTYSKPERIESNQGITDYRYGADRNRYKRIEASSDGTNGTTFYLGNVEFISKADGTRLYKRYIGGVAIQDLYLTGGSSTLSYTHKDHIGSIDTITEGDDNALQGQITEAMSFGAWGERRDAINWRDPVMGVLASLRNITPRGFTGHEMIDHAGIIHMNGRIYDSKLGRFLQADPNVQAPDNSQNLNRYSYVLNNPLSYTDPSGFFFKAIGNFVGKYWRQLVAVGIGIATAGIASGLSFWAGLAVSVAGGALAGYVSTGSLNGALIGAFSAAAFYGVGSYFEGLSHSNGLEAANAAGTAGAGNVQQAVAYASNASLNSVQRIGQVVAHGMAGGVVGNLQGGRFAHGFVSAGVAQSFARTIGRIGNGYRSFGISAARVTAAAVVGGTASEMTGGKFANGAVTGALTRAFTDDLRNGSAVNSQQGKNSGAFDMLTDVIGKIWTLPNTVVGTLVGISGLPFGATITFQDNAIVFNNFPFGPGGALTLGNVILNTGSTLDVSVPTYRAQELNRTNGRKIESSDFIRLGDHERAHTFQYQLLGPFFLPGYALSGGGISSRNSYEAAADKFAQSQDR